MNPLLVILNPRRIPSCIDAFNEQAIDKAWLTGYTEGDLESVIADLIATTRYTHYTLISDDCIITRRALHAVLQAARQHPVTTGYCNLARNDPRINLTHTPLRDEAPATTSYSFYTSTDIAAHPNDLVPTFFTGMTLTTMPRDLWQQFPFQAYDTLHGPGNASDYHLSRRLGQAGIPIVAPKAGWVDHLKEEWGRGDIALTHRILIGTIDPSVTIQRANRGARHA